MPPAPMGAMTSYEPSRVPGVSGIASVASCHPSVLRVGNDGEVHHRDLDDRAWWRQEAPACGSIIPRRSEGRLSVAALGLRLRDHAALARRPEFFVTSG